MTLTDDRISLGQLGRGAGKLGLVARDQKKVVAVLGEQLRKRTADALGAAGDDHGRLSEAASDLK